MDGVTLYRISMYSNVICSFLIVHGYK